jgi:hypothetical protein
LGVFWTVDEAVGLAGVAVEVQKAHEFMAVFQSASAAELLERHSFGKKRLVAGVEASVEIVAEVV